MSLRPFLGRNVYKSAVTDPADRRRNATHSKTPENWFTHLKGHSQRKQEVVPEAQTDESTLLELRGHVLCPHNPKCPYNAGM